MKQVYLSLGSNIDRRTNINFAIKELSTNFKMLSQSRIYQNQAVGFTGNDFYNLVLGLATDIDVYEMLAFLKALERKAGRDLAASKFSPRTLDIDILLFGADVYQPELDIPREEITRYAFVLQPLAEIAPYFIHPVLKQPISDLWRDMPADQHLSKVVTI